MNKGIFQGVATLITVISILMLFSGTARSDATIPPIASDHPFLAGGMDRRPHVPRIFELMSPMVKDVSTSLARQLPPDSLPMKCAAMLNSIAAELHNVYLLSMATSPVFKEAEETYLRVEILQEQIKVHCK